MQLPPEQANERGWREYNSLQSNPGKGKRMSRIWHDPVSDHWWQVVYFGGKKKYRDLGVMGQMTGNLRAWIDAQTEHPRLVEGVAAKEPRLVAAMAVQETTGQSTAGQAAAWLEQIKAKKAGNPR